MTAFTGVVNKRMLPLEMSAVNVANVAPVLTVQFSVMCTFVPSCIMATSVYWYAEPDVIEITYLTDRYVAIAAEATT